MRKTALSISTAASVVALMGSLVLAPATVTAAEKKAENLTPVQQGKKLAFNRKKGNCLACHQIAGGNMAGNIGPPLVAMKARYPDKAKLRAQIWDATTKNPNTTMPPFGRHKILNDKQIDLITEYIYTL